MDHIPTEQNIKLNLLEMTPEGPRSFAVKRHDSLPRMKTGTTTVGCKIKDGVIVATDNRATMGAFVANKNARKMHQIQPYMYLTIAGSVADAVYLVDLLKAETEIYKLRNGKPIGVGQTAKLLQNILFNNKGYFQVGHILGGYTEREGGLVFNIGGYGSLLEEDYTSVGSGSVFALGVLETDWRPDLTPTEGLELCARAVRSAIIRDMASGNGIDLVVLTKGQPPQEYRFEVSDAALISNKFDGSWEGAKSPKPE